MTPKRIVGIIAFIFLGILVYSVASIDYQNSFYNADNQQALNEGTSNPALINEALTSDGIKNVSNSAATTKWRPPIIDAGKNTPLVITAILEGFVLLCAVLLGKAEPVMNQFVERAVKNTKRKN